MTAIGVPVYGRAWNNNGVLRKLLAIAILLVGPGVGLHADDAVPGPKLLLSAQRLRRLKRDRERKTARWVGFENRVNGFPDSSERGFELALYYAITGDEAKGREAIAWAIQHRSARQAAIVMDWCAGLLSEEQRGKLRLAGAVDTDGHLVERHFEGWRDAAFMRIASGGTPAIPDTALLRQQLMWWIESGVKAPEQLYALCEFIYVVRASTHTDVRETDAAFFNRLPEIVLLSAKPSQLNSPALMLHAAALALVAIDPNLPSSQFLQSWALEDSQTLREGPGVAYELLWADPYLPGVGYQNMEPSVYDDHFGLFARAGWEPNSCWIEISAKGVDQENCPANWQAETVTFGHLTLIPMTGRCVEIPRVQNHNDSVMVWKLKPGGTITSGKGKEAHEWEADCGGVVAAGLKHRR